MGHPFLLQGGAGQGRRNNSERPVDAPAENSKLPTHLLTTSNQEMLAHLKKSGLGGAGQWVKSSGGAG